MRSKSETNLKSPCMVAKPEVNECPGLGEVIQSSRLHVGHLLDVTDSWSGQDLARSGCGRPKSWSPDNTSASELFSVALTGEQALQFFFSFIILFTFQF
jgi:hypothetical protein